MEHIKNIQALVDENKETLSTGLVTDLMKQCQEAYNKYPTNLYRIHYLYITSYDAEIIEEERSLIVEECENDDNKPRNWSQVFLHLRMPKGFQCSDVVVRDERIDTFAMKVVVRVEPFVSYKRARED